MAEWVEEQGGTATLAADGEILAIDLARSWIGEIDLWRLEGLQRLERLDLAQTHIADPALAVLSKLPALRELSLFFCEHVTDAGAAQIRHARGLERLNVRGTKISDSGVKFLAELAHLRDLDIGITEISDSSIESMERMARLESLAIGGNRIGEVGISGLRALKRLRHLDVSGAQVTDSGIWAVTVTDLNLDEIGALAGLESLNLAAPSPEYVDAVSSGVPRLRGAIRVSDFGAERLARIASLRRLDVSRSQLTRAGLERLWALEHLEELVLSHSRSIDDSAGTALLAMRTLARLDVSFTQFGDAGLRSLTAHPSLLQIVAAGSSVGDEAAREFEASRGGRRVIR